MVYVNGRFEVDIAVIDPSMFMYLAGLDAGFVIGKLQAQESMGLASKKILRFEADSFADVSCHKFVMYGKGTPSVLSPTM